MAKAAKIDWKPYRSIGKPGEPYPNWFRALDGKSGAYAIKLGREVVYVGESHAGRLRKTIARHFQAWSRRKDWWRGFFSSGADPGRTYPREECEIGFVLTPADRAVAMQDRLIRRLRPRDNKLGKPADDDVPF